MYSPFKKKTCKPDFVLLIVLWMSIWDAIKFIGILSSVSFIHQVMDYFHLRLEVLLQSENLLWYQHEKALLYLKTSCL